jgi:hypothetical protein
MTDAVLERLKNSKKMACDGWVYSVQRMDLLIITISGAGFGCGCGLGCSLAMGYQFYQICK